MVRAMTYGEKAEIIMNHLDMHIQVKNQKMIDDITESIITALEEIEEKEPTRTLREVQGIVECVRAGIPVQVDYADPDEDSETIYKQRW